MCMCMACVWHVYGMYLVDRVVGEVHVQVLERGAARADDVPLGREAREPLVEDLRDAHAMHMPYT